MTDEARKLVPSVEEIVRSLEPEQLERLAQALEKYPSMFQVLRAFEPEEIMLRPDQVPSDARFGLVVDTEGTGTDVEKDLMVEIGMVEIAYDPLTHYIYGVTRILDQLEDPGIPMPEEAFAVNGISDEMLAGKHFDDVDVNEMVETADFVICHNSAYDRPMLEKRFPIFAGKAFACSLKQVDWRKAGIGSAKQDYIAYRLGFFYHAHRADSDCLALVKILNTQLAGLDNQTPFQMLMDEYQKEERRIWATGAPIDTKDMLKFRKEVKYIWSDGSVPETEKAWHGAVPLENFESELTWLYENAYKRRAFSVAVDSVDAFNRFTKRRNKLKNEYRPLKTESVRA